MSELVFVYGTLKEDGYNFPIMEMSKAVLVSKEYWAPYLKLYSQGMFPAAVFTDEKYDQIQGQVYSVETLEHLDYLEGYPTHYDRVQIDTEFGKVWIYVYADPQGTLIPTGIWAL